MKKRRKVCVYFLLGLAALACTARCLARKRSGDDPVLEDPQDPTVYVTDVGHKYHRADCVHLQASRTAISKSDAEAEGYEACGVCKP